MTNSVQLFTLVTCACTANNSGVHSWHLPTTIEYTKSVTTDTIHKHSCIDTIHSVPRVCRYSYNTTIMNSVST